MNKYHSNLIGLFCSIALASSCAMTVDTGDDAGELNYQMFEPTLHHITPSLSLGDKLEVTGSHFVPADVGNLYLKFSGNFNGVLNGEESVNVEIPLQVESESRASTILEKVVFDSDNDDIGTFSGTVTLINRRSTGGSNVKSLSSEAESTSITVNPSIAMTRLRAINANIACSMVTGGSNEKQDLEVGFKGLGLGVPSPENPWSVTVSFLAPNMGVYYLKEDIYNPDADDVWPLGWIPIDNNTGSVRKVEPNGPDATRASFSFVADGQRLAQDGSIVIEPNTIPLKVDVSPSIDIGGENVSEAYLLKLQTGAIPMGSGARMNSGFNVEINTADGLRLSRVVNFNVDDYFSVGTNQKKYLRRIGEIEEVSGCTPCSIDGPSCEVSYTDSKSFSLNRGVTTNVDSSSTGDFGNTWGPWFAWQQTSTRSWSDSFGENFSESITEETTQSTNFSVPVIPGYQAQSFRQAVTIEKHREIIGHNVCGYSAPIGFAVHTDYLVGIQVATGQGCPVQSDYQRPQTFDPPVPYENPYTNANTQPIE